MTDGNRLNYMRARYYSAEIRRFVNQDILLGNVADGQSLNRFAFVTGNPVSFVDPFGLSGTAAVEIWLMRGAGGLMCVLPVPGSRVVGLGIIMLSLSEDTPKTLPGEGLAPPGDCGQGFYEFLRDQKEFACTQPRACSPKIIGNCGDILFNLDLNNACVKARDDIMKQCFRGGDDRHQRERQKARQGVWNCIEQAARSSCPGF
jgi:RHS repeat-associated protein